MGSRSAAERELILYVMVQGGDIFDSVVSSWLSQSYLHCVEQYTNLCLTLDLNNGPGVSCMCLDLRILYPLLLNHNAGLPAKLQLLGFEVPLSSLHPVKYPHLLPRKSLGFEQEVHVLKTLAVGRRYVEESENTTEDSHTAEEQEGPISDIVDHIRNRVRGIKLA